MTLRILLITLFFTHASSIHSDPLPAIVIMVKNEEQNICQTLDPYIKAGIQSFLVFDTGSTDNTIETISNYFDQHSVTDAHIRQEPFINFAASRNRALTLAREIFPEADFFLIPDAEWYMDHVQKLLDFCDSERASITPVYFLSLNNGGEDLAHPRLFRARIPVQFINDVHEYPVPIATTWVPMPVRFRYEPNNAGRKSSAARWKRDYVKLKDRYDANPKDPCTLFYLHLKAELIILF